MEKEFLVEYVLSDIVLNTPSTNAAAGPLSVIVSDLFCLQFFLGGASAARVFEMAVLGAGFEAVSYTHLRAHET